MQNNWRPPFEKKVLSAVICAGFLALAPNAHAGLVLNSSTIVELPDSALPPSSDADTDERRVSIVTALTDNTGSARARALGDDRGRMNSRVSGSGVFTAQSSIQQSVDFTNTTGSIQNYFFDFTIERGGLATRIDSSSLLGSDLATVGNRVSISLNNMEIFNSGAELTVNTTGISLNTEGLVLGTYSSGADTYRWGSVSDRLNLGTIGIGETFTLDYEITTFASSNIAYPACYDDSNGYGYGDDGENLGCPSNAIWSVFGDPNNINSLPISSLVTSVPASVPTPSALFLLGGGIAALAYSRRRKQRNH